VERARPALWVLVSRVEHNSVQKVLEDVESECLWCCLEVSLMVAALLGGSCGRVAG
jgi:hypothetical protein